MSKSGELEETVKLARRAAEEAPARESPIESADESSGESLAESATVLSQPSGSENTPGDLAQLVDGGTADLDKQLMRAQLRTAMFGTAAGPVKVGRFLLLHRLGRGGMGEVYTAHDDQLDRQVAIKIVRPEAVGTGSSARRRLLREAQTQARLSHPNVVQIYEAGIVHKQVYLAMELIRGSTLGAWVATHTGGAEQFPWQDILDKLVDAGKGLAAAHRAGLVHRDFKPANVLVGDDGRVCVADFGLACGDTDTSGIFTDSTDSGEPPTRETKPPEPSVRPQGTGRSQLETVTLRRPSASDSSVDDRRHSPIPRLTETGAIVGTPAYMSPEQFAGNPVLQPVDSRSDQFSFCVTAYEALYGDRPYPADDMASLAAAFADGEPVPPPRNSQVPARVWKVIKRGLAIEPDERYPTMDALIGDLSWDRQRRRRRLIGAGLLAAGVALGSVLALNVGDERPAPCAAAGQSVDELWNDESKARAKDSFLSVGLPYGQDSWMRLTDRLDDYADKLRSERIAVCEATYVRREQTEQLFSLKSLCLDQRQLKLQVFLEALQNSNAALVEHASNIAAALPPADGCRDSKTLALGMQPASNPEIAAEVSDIRAQLARAWLRHLAVQLDEAVAISTQQLARAETLNYPPVHAEAMWQLGVALRDRARDGDVNQAEVTLSDAIDLAERHRHDELAADVWLALTRLATDNHVRKDQGHRYARRALAASARLSEDSERYARAISEQALLFQRESAHEEAIAGLRRALALADSNRVDPLWQSDFWHSLANALRAAGRMDKARAAFGRARVLLHKEFGPSHPQLIWLERDEAIFLGVAGELDLAYRQLSSVRDRWTVLHGESHLDVALAEIELADIQQQRGNLTSADNHARVAGKILQQLFPGGHYEQWRVHSSLAVVAFRRHEYQQALGSFERALAILVQALGDQHIQCALVRLSISETLARLARHDDALGYLPGIEKVIANIEHPAIQSLPFKIRGVVYLQQNRPAAAERELHRAYELLQTQSGYALEQADVQWSMARALRAQLNGSRPDVRNRARDMAEKALAVYAAHGESGALERDEISQWLAHLN